MFDWSERLRGEAMVVLLSRMANVGAGAVFVFLTARHLGPSGRGDIVIAFTVAWATTSLSDLGTSTSGRISLLRPDSDVTRNDVLSLTFALVPLQIVVSAAVVMVLAVTAMNLSLWFAIAVVALSVLTMVYNSTCALLYGLRKYRDVLKVDIASAVLQVVLLMSLLIMDRLTSASAVFSMACGLGLGSVALIYRIGLSQGRIHGKMTAHWRGLVIEGLLPMAGTAAVFVALRMNRLVLAIAIGSHSLGLFSIALAVPEALRVFPKAVAQVVADRGRSGIDAIPTSRRHCRRFVVGHSVLLGVGVVLGWILIPTVFGEGFVDARNVLVVVTVAEVILSVHLMQQALLVAFSRPQGIGLPQITGAAITIAANLLMIPRWGMEGAAWACLIGYSALTVTSVIWTRREIGRLPN